MIMIVGVIATLVVLGAIALLFVSARVHSEIAQLRHTFDAAARALTPLTATLRADRERLTTRLAPLTDSATDVDRAQR